MAFNEEIKSNRLLQSRRFTQDSIPTSAEVFTRVLDLGASEIYTQTDLIPTSSLPFSGSSQDQAIYSVGGKNILKYWYRERLTPSDTLNPGETSYNTWFFISGSNYNSVFASELQPGQQTNFVSPKYAPSLLLANTEGTPPGYLVRLHNQDSNVIIDPATYTFDYKTGIVQFNEQSGLAVSADIRLTAYQYIGETLEDFILDGGGAGFPFSGSAVITGSLLISGSGAADELIVSGNVIATEGFTGSLFGTASYTNFALVASSSVASTTANSILVYDTDVDTSLRPLFTTGTSGTGKVVYADGSDDITFNPLSNTLNIGGFTEGVPTGSINLTGSLNILSGSITIASGSLIGTSSWALSASNAINAQTASYVNTLNQNVTINGNLSAHTGSFNVLTVNYISASVIYSSGSNVFGDELTDTQTFTGSVYITGSNFTWNGYTVITTEDTASMTVLSASYASDATSASYASNATSASYATDATSASYATDATSASYASNATSASYAADATSASYATDATSASYAADATSASYASNATSASYATDATSASYAADATSASYASNATSASYATDATSASYATDATSASYATDATSASYASNATSASYAADATSASYATDATSASYATDATSASYATDATSASYATDATSASYATDATSASYAADATSASYATDATSASYSSNATSASYALDATSASYALNATNTLTASYVNTLNQDVTINGTLNVYTGSLNYLTVTNDATITGNLTVNGTTTYINVEDLLVRDKFILLNSGSLTNPLNEGGIIVQTTSSEGVAYGTALYYDQQANRWVVNRSSSVAWNATSSVLSTQSDFIVTVTGSAGAPTGTPVNFGTTDYFYGQMYIQTDTNDIYIYA